MEEASTVGCMIGGIAVGFAVCCLRIEGKIVFEEQVLKRS
jgi:hypothetical protein